MIAIDKDQSIRIIKTNQTRDHRVVIPIQMLPAIRMRKLKLKPIQLTKIPKKFNPMKLKNQNQNS